MRRLQFLLVLLLTTGFATTSLYGQNVPANQVNFANSGVAQVMSFDDLTQPTGPQMFSYYGTFLSGSGMGQQFLDFNGPNSQIFRINVSSPRDSLVIDPLGIGVGIQNPVHAGINVYSDGGILSQLTDAKISIDNNESLVKDREQLRLRNNGPARFGMTNDNVGATWSFVVTDLDQFQIRKNGTSTPSFIIQQNGAFTFNSNNIAQFGILPDGNAFLKGRLFEGSDRNIKKNIVAVDTENILQKVLDLPISEWTYKSDDESIRHMGPMAQDFRASFGLGINDTTISTPDTSAVAIVAIQGLNQKLEAKDEKIAELADQLKSQSEIVSEQAALIAEMAERMERLEAMVTLKTR